MSRYSGKCDLADHIEIFGEKSVLNSTIYIADNKEPLEFHSIKDLIPYYPYIIGTSAGNKDSCVMRLSKESYIDYIERDHI